MSQPKQDVLLSTIKDMCASVSRDFSVAAMQKDLLDAVSQIVSNERAYANRDRGTIQPETDNVVFDLGVKILDKNWLPENGQE
jgi:hypothetical protein